LATYSWTIPTGNIITGSTYIKDTDNKIQDTMNDLADFVNSSGAYTGQGLMFDYVNKASNQTITGVKTFSNGLIGNVTSNYFC
jgi:regulatory protein YycH of two-component signal transduction system YycFG